MSIRARLALAMLGLVLLTMALAWTVTGRAVLRPFASAVFKEHLQQSVYVAERIEAGAEPGVVAAQTGLDLRVLPFPPDERPPPRRGGEEAEKDGKVGKAGRRGGGRRWGRGGGGDGFGGEYADGVASADVEAENENESDGDARSEGEHADGVASADVEAENENESESESENEGENEGENENEGESENEGENERENNADNLADNPLPSNTRSTRRRNPRSSPDPERPPGKDEWLHREFRGRHVMYRPGARSLIAVDTDVGWVVVRRDLDVDAPAKRGALFLLLVAGAVGLGTIGLAVMATRPLSTSQDAMERIAAGELDHRLELKGPTELVAAARSFNAMADRVEAMLRREKELMAGISHELRTPLTRLGLEVELLRDAGVSERRADAMAADLAEMERLIQEMLNISRLELGQQPLHRRPTKLRAVVDEALRQQALPDHEVVVEGEGETLELDRELTTRALGNLLSNARRYTPPGGEVRVRLEGHTVSVLDRGPGVAEASLPRLFEPFFREDASRAKATGGLGLGLMIVAQVMRLHGGSARAWNREGGGLGVALTFTSASSETSTPSA